MDVRLKLILFGLIFSLGSARADYLLMPEGALMVPKATPARATIHAPPATPVEATKPSESTKSTGRAEKVTAPTTTPPTTKAPPACSSRTGEVKEMIAKVMKTNVFNISWREDVPKIGSSGKFIVKDVNGSVRINMINGDGNSVGIAPARFCLRNTGGHLELRVGLQRSFLKFGSRMMGMIDVDAQVNAMLAKLPNPNEMPLIVTAARDGSKIHIADGIDGTQIGSDFSPGAVR